MSSQKNQMDDSSFRKVDEFSHSNTETRFPLLRAALLAPDYSYNQVHQVKIPPPPKPTPKISRDQTVKNVATRTTIVCVPTTVTRKGRSYTAYRIYNSARSTKEKHKQLERKKRLAAEQKAAADDKQQKKICVNNESCRCARVRPFRSNSSAEKNRRNQAWQWYRQSKRSKSQVVYVDEWGRDMNRMRFRQFQLSVSKKQTEPKEQRRIAAKNVVKLVDRGQKRSIEIENNEIVVMDCARVRTFARDRTENDPESACSAADKELNEDTSSLPFVIESVKNELVDCELIVDLEPELKELKIEPLELLQPMCAQSEMSCLESMLSSKADDSINSGVSTHNLQHLCRPLVIVTDRLSLNQVHSHYNSCPPCSVVVHRLSDKIVDKYWKQ